MKYGDIRFLITNTTYNFKSLFFDFFTTTKLPQYSWAHTRCIQLIVEYCMLCYRHVYADAYSRHVYMATFMALGKAQINLISSAFRQYMCVNDYGGAETIRSRCRLESDLFNTLMKHILISSIAKIPFCHRDIAYWKLLTTTAPAYARVYLDETLIDMDLAMQISRLFEHISLFKKSTFDISDMSGFWNPILHKSGNIYLQSFFSGEFYSGDNNCTTTLKKHLKGKTYIALKTNSPTTWGTLYLISNKKRSNIYKEYSAVLAMLTLLYQSQPMEKLYCDRRLDHHLLVTHLESGVMDLPRHSQLSTDGESALEKNSENKFNVSTTMKNENELLLTTIGTLNKLSGWIYADVDQPNFENNLEKENNEQKEMNYYTDNKHLYNSNNTNHSTDYEAKTIETTSFVTEFLLWAKCHKT